MQGKNTTRSNQCSKSLKTDSEIRGNRIVSEEVRRRQPGKPYYSCIIVVLPRLLLNGDSSAKGRFTRASGVDNLLWLEDHIAREKDTGGPPLFKDYIHYLKKWNFLAHLSEQTSFTFMNDVRSSHNLAANHACLNMQQKIGVRETEF
ncbi:hypothetical protein TNCV_4651551 [Trichonephila clavipes]|nr:hypothetical protein TNCV_4651551 [Trichonephila clavipes]